MTTPARAAPGPSRAGPPVVAGVAITWTAAGVLTAAAVGGSAGHPLHLAGSLAAVAPGAAAARGDARASQEGEAS